MSIYESIENPIGVKIGPSVENDYLIKLLDTLNPENERGKITLITRMGSEDIYDKLPNLIKKVRENQNNVIWSCDPMHANTYKSSTGYKTRSFDKILSEIEAFFNVHHQEGSFPGEFI